MVVCIAIGNTLRGDDGVAHYAARLIEPGEHVRLIDVLQLTPELACDFRSANAVFFLDADPSGSVTTLSPVKMPNENGSLLAHTINSADLVAIARKLYGFAGEAFLCHIPARRFEHGETLTIDAKAAAQSAARMVAKYASLQLVEGSSATSNLE